MNLQVKLMALGVIVALLACSHICAYRSGWSAHADKINRETADKKQKAEIKQQQSNAKAEEVRFITETKYRTVYRDVIKYVQDPNRTVCKFDDAAVQLRQQAIDAANAVSLHAK